MAKSIPDDYPRLTPYLIVDDATRLRLWRRASHRPSKNRQRTRFA